MATDTDTGEEQKPLTQPRTRYSFDLATVLGISCAVLLIATAIFLGGSPGAFFDIKAVLIVIGGTFGVTTACFSLGDMMNAISTVGRTVFRSQKNPQQAALQLLQLAQIARYRGVLALQNYMAAVEKQPMLAQGLNMAVDGATGDEIERILQREVQGTAQRHSRSVSVLRKAADISPAMGLIGTLVGLVQMLGNLEDPATIGPSMAVALLTTFYGAILANVVFTPLASKMERMASEEMLLNHLYVMSASSIGRQENPRRLEMLLNTILPPAFRVDYFG